MDSHRDHCLNQIIRFSKMLDRIREPDRSREKLFAQLGFNLGRFIELIHHKDGRAVWQIYESCIDSDNYQQIRNYAYKELCAI